MNNHSGLLTFSSSRNHRGQDPAVLKLFRWLAEHGPGSFGLAHLHDDEAPTEDAANSFEVVRLLRGRIEHLEDPFFSPIVPRVYPPYP